MEGAAPPPPAGATAEARGGAAPLTLHATCVRVGGAGLLILGPSGSGKSGLALELMALGAALVADDRVSVTPEAGRLVARCPAGIEGMIEARGLGLLSAPAAGPTPVALALDLGTPETERLPPKRSVTINGIVIPLVHKPETGHLAAAILHYVQFGRSA